MFDKLITIQKIDEATEKGTDLFNLHARINKTAGSEYINAGANRSKATLTFEVRHFRKLEDISYNRGSYRIKYRGQLFNIVDYDDYREKHLTVKLIGESI